jgi:hypothetical protein
MRLALANPSGSHTLMLPVAPQALQTTKILPLLLPSHLFFSFLAQKSRVKPQNHLTYSNKSQ